MKNDGTIHKIVMTEEGMGLEQALLTRIRGEYREMPGLRLDLFQACRLWQIDHPTCLILMERLVTEGTLYRRTDGTYCAFPAVARKALKVTLDGPSVSAGRKQA